MTNKYVPVDIARTHSCCDGKSTPWLDIDMSMGTTRLLNWVWRS